jgi:ubiquitin-like 1-activating enzyme E1 B
MGYPTAQELEALARETEELKKIKEAMGSDVYGKTVFDKIFTRDIEEMWKNRTPPTPLFYDELVQYMTTDSATTTSGLKDQHIWSIRECFDMFVDRYVCISSLALRHDRTSK